MISAVSVLDLINFHVRHVDKIILLIITYNMEPILVFKPVQMVNLLIRQPFCVCHAILDALPVTKMPKIVQVVSW